MSANIQVPDDDTKTEKKMIQREKSPQVSTDLWSLYLDEANRRAKAKADLWNGSLSAFLLFAGLFAGVVSSFVIDSRAGLQPNASGNVPSNSTKVPISTIAINFLWFISLTSTLISALAAVLAQTWVAEFSLVPTNDFKGAMERWIHDNKAEHWQLDTAIAWITVLIQLALFLFLTGFAIQAVADHRSLGWTILSFVGATLVLYIGITVLAFFYPATPFRTPFSQLVTNNKISDLLNPNAAKNRRRSIWEFMTSMWDKLFKIPTENEARLGICWAILQHSSNTATIHAAVLELTGKKITQEQTQQLLEFGLPDELSNRLTHLPVEKETDIFEHLKDYLQVIMWMVDDCHSDVAKRFSTLLANDDAFLLKLNDLPPACRGMAFAIRVDLLINIWDHGKIHGTDWTAMIDSLDTSVALDIFRAAIRGLEHAKHEQDLSHLRQDCARMLAAYIGSPRFLNTGLVTSQITGDTVLITQRPAEQDTVERIHVFFSHLEEAWKHSMCTGAIRLMADVRTDQRVMGFSLFLSVAQNANFRDAINDVLPELGSSLEKVDWKTSVDCLGRLSEIYKQDSQGTFHEAIKGIFPQIISLLADSKEEVCSAVRRLIDEMGTGKNHNAEAWIVSEIDRIVQKSVKDLRDNHWYSRVKRLQSLTQLIKTGKISNTKIIGEGQNILACTTFADEDVRLSAIGTLQELAKHEEFHHIIDDHMDGILRLVSDENPSVRAAAVEFVYELAGQVDFQGAINRNIPAFITDDYGLQLEFARRGRLQALGEIIQSGRLYDNGILITFRELPIWLSDADNTVRQTALQIVTLAAEHVALAGKIKDVVPQIVEMFQDELEDEEVRVAALATCAAVATSVVTDGAHFSQFYLAELKATVNGILQMVLKCHSSIQIASLKALSTLAQPENLTMVIPGIAELFEAEDEDVRVVAFETVADIAKIQLAEIAKIQLQVAKDKDLRVATVRTAAETAEIQKHINVLAEQRQLLRKTISNIMAMILRALDCTQETQIAALRTLATFSESDDLCDTLNDNVLNKIISGLSQEEEEEDYVTLQTLDTLAVLASKTQFHNNVKGAIRDTLPLLEHWSWRIKQKALSTFVIFARNGILDLGDEITSRMISMLSAGDSDTSASVLNILYSAAKPGHGDGPVMNPDILVATDSLTNPNWHVRVAAFEVLESLANDPSYKKINFPEYATILNCIADEIVEEVQVAGLRTLFRLVDVEIFRDRVAVPETVLNPLIRSSSEDTRISTIGILSSYSTKAKFFSTIQSVIPTIIERLKDTDEDSTIRVTIVQTLCDMVKRDRFWTGSPVFVKHVGDIITSLLHDKDTAVQMAALQVVPVISQHDAFGTTVENSLEVLLPAAHKKEASGAVDETFRIEVLNILSDLAKNDGLRNKIDVMPSWIESYELATREGSWLTRVAVLKLMSVLGAKTREPVKAMVVQILPEINDTLHDSEDIGLRMAGVQLLSIPAVKEIPSSEFNALVSTLVTLLPDPEEKVRITALHTLSELAKQEVFRGAINRTLPALLDSLEHEEWNIRVAALKTCAVLAEDMIFSEFLKRATTKIIACIRFPDDNVQCEALITISRLSREEAFRLAVLNAAPDIVSKFGSPYWSVRLQVLSTLSVFVENDAFGDIMHSVLPSIVECLKDEDEEVRTEAAKMLVTLVQHKPYQPSIRDTLQAPGKILEELTSDHFRIVRMAALPLIPNVVELVVLSSTEVSTIILSIVKLLSEDEEEDMWMAALNAISALISYTPSSPPSMKQDVSDAENIPPKPWNLTQESVDVVVNVIPKVLSLFKHTRNRNFWDAAAQVLLSLAKIGGYDEEVYNTVLSALQDSNPGAQILGLNVLAGVIGQHLVVPATNSAFDYVLKSLNSVDLDVRLLALHVAVLFRARIPLALSHDPGEDMDTAIETEWADIVIAIGSKLKPISDTVVEKVGKLADYVDVFGTEKFTNIIPLMVDVFKNEPPGIITSLRALSKLAAYSTFHEALLRVVPRITALLSNKRSDTRLRLEALQNLLILAEQQIFHVKIREQLSTIISALKDSDTQIRAVSLKVILKLVEGVSPDKFSERIKSSLPILLSLTQNATTLEDSIRLITCLAGNKTLRFDVLAKVRPSILGNSQSPAVWGHLKLMACLFEEKRLEHEETDLQFVLCLITSKRPEVQNFMLKFMTTTLQQYLVTCIKAEKFPPSFLLAFSSPVTLKNL